MSVSLQCDGLGLWPSIKAFDPNTIDLISKLPLIWMLLNFELKWCLPKSLNLRVIGRDELMGLLFCTPRKLIEIFHPQRPHDCYSPRRAMYRLLHMCVGYMTISRAMFSGILYVQLIHLKDDGVISTVWKFKNFPLFCKKESKKPIFSCH